MKEERKKERKKERRREKRKEKEYIFQSSICCINKYLPSGKIKFMIFDF